MTRTTAALVAVLVTATLHAQEVGWTANGRDAEGTRYLPASDITRENVNRLEVAWTYRTGETDPALRDPQADRLRSHASRHRGDDVRRHAARAGDRARCGHRQRALDLRSGHRAGHHLRRLRQPRRLGLARPVCRRGRRLPPAHLRRDSAVATLRDRRPRRPRLPGVRRAGHGRSEDWASASRPSSPPHIRSPLRRWSSMVW